jgi:predicted phosphodiesterase
MRIAVVSDIHDNLTALEAVVEDLKEFSPDLVLHGGDLVMGGSSPAEVVDLVQSLGWRGVYGNSDESVMRPEALDEFSRDSTASPELWNAVYEQRDYVRDALGAARISWLRTLPLLIDEPEFALLHASPWSAWRCPAKSSTVDEIASIYAPLNRPMVVYGHIHEGFVRTLPGLTVCNSGSVSQSFDGDPRASYLQIDNRQPRIRRVEYDLEQEIASIRARRVPYAGWIERMLRSGRPQLP